MKLNTPARTFNTYGGGSRFALVSALVELSEEDFGPALQEIELMLCFPSRLPFSKQGVDRSLRGSYKDFHDHYCATLPKRRFLRKQAKLKIEVLAEFAHAEDLDEPRQGFCLPWQSAVLDILISELEHCRGKFKPTDDFRLRDFLHWLTAQRQNLPRTQKAAQALDEQWTKLTDEERDKLSDWDRLGIDWSEYHKDARAVVSDPRLWSLGHDFAPNGNDNGADLLTRFRAEKSRWARGGGKAFYRNLAREWGFDPQAQPSDSFDYDANREVVVGLAFAFLKLFAYCPAWLAEQAVSEIKEYQSYLATHHLDWQHRDGCLEYQALMLECLANCPRK